MKRGCLIATLAVMGAIIALVLFDWMMPSAQMRALPKTATDKQEYFQGFNDYVRLIKDSLPAEDYEKYAKNLGMTKRLGSGELSRKYVNLGHGDAPEWWDPPRADGQPTLNMSQSGFGF